MSNQNAVPEWIWLENADSANAYVDFVESFEIGSLDEPVLLKVSVDGDFIAFVNGERALLGQFADQPAHKVYQLQDVTGYCRKGANSLCITAWHQGIDCMTCMIAPAGILFGVSQDGKTLCASGRNTLCARTPGYRFGDIERITHQLGLSFDYTSGKPREMLRYAVPSNINTELTQRETKQLDVLPAPDVTLCMCGSYKETATGTSAVRIARAELNKFDCETSILKPDGSSPIRLSSPDGDGVFAIIDMGREMSGLLTLDMIVDKPTEVLIGYGEHLADGRVRTEIGGRNFGVRYVAQPGRSMFTHWLRTLGGRYLELHINAHDAKLRYAGLLPLRYPVDERPYFRCENELHQRIYDVCRDTLLNCMHSHYEDCPWREQALYACDSRNQMLAGYYVFGETTFVRASLRLLAQSQREDGLLEICSPARAEITIPSFSLSFIIALEEYLRYSGDSEFVREMLPFAERILGAMDSRRDESGLITNFTEPGYWNFYEWRPTLDGATIHRTESIPVTRDAPLNALCSLAYMRLARVCEWLGCNAEAETAQRRQASLNAALDAFWDESLGAYADFIDTGKLTGGSELTQSLMLLCGACPEARRDMLLKSLTNGTLIPATLCYAMFKYEALLSCGHGYEKWVWSDIERIWGGMLAAGATTFWETEQGQSDFDNAGSLCHGWSAAPAYLYFAYGLGLRPSAPGYAEYELKPVSMDLGHVKVLVNTPKGLMTLERNGDGDVTIL